MRCFVLIDLKTDDLTHQDLGQMQMYVNYYTRKLMNEGDNPPIGIVLCADKSDSIVEYTLPEDNDQVFAAKYLPYLPSKEELARELSAEYRAINEATNGETQRVAAHCDRKPPQPSQAHSRLRRTLRNNTGHGRRQRHSSRGWRA